MSRKKISDDCDEDKIQFSVKVRIKHIDLRKILKIAHMRKSEKELVDSSSEMEWIGEKTLL